MQSLTAPDSVLLCFDGSDHAAEAIRRAALLLRTRSAVVVHVPRDASGGEVAETGRELALAAGFDSVSVVETAHPYPQEAILTEARRVGVGVIATGSHGRSTVESSLLGSVSSALVDQADRPVLVVRSGAAGWDESAVAPVLICYDGSDLAKHAIRTAGELLAGRDAIVASLMEPVDDGAVLRQQLPWPVDLESQGRLAQIDRMEALGPPERAEQGAATAQDAGFAPRPYPMPGDGPAWARFLETAAAEDAACIVVGHRSTAKHLVSTAHRLVHHADRPVLVVPADSSK